MSKVGLLSGFIVKLRSMLVCYYYVDFVIENYSVYCYYYYWLTDFCGTSKSKLYFYP